MTHRIAVPLLCILTLVLPAAGRAAVRYTLAGSSTVTRVLMPHRPGVESAYGVEIQMLPTGSGRGLQELASGRAEAAMLSGPVEYLLERAAEGGAPVPRPEQLDRLKLAATPKAEVVALVNSDNPIRRLTAEQLRAVLTGEIDNWSALGGAERPIHVIVPDALDGVRATLEVELLQGRAIAGTARCVENQAELLAAVAGDPAAVSVVARISVPGGVACAEVVPTIAVPLTIVAVRERLGQDTLLEMVLNSLHSRAR
jgi:phosphate transport system substrate-binding protein